MEKTPKIQTFKILSLRTKTTITFVGSEITYFEEKEYEIEKHDDHFRIKSLRKGDYVNVPVSNVSYWKTN